jgi:hypothetical protein
MTKFFFGAMWSGSFVACSVSGAALVQGWARGSAAGWEMMRLGTDAYLLLPVLLVCFLYRWLST